MYIFTKSLPALAMTAMIVSASASASSIKDIDTKYSAPHVNMTVDDEGTARLTGTVDNHIDKRILGDKAEALYGVDRVVNNLFVDPPISK